MTDFNRSPEAEEIFKNKHKPKNPIKYKIELSEEQKQAKQLIYNNPIVLLKGAAGSGKTLVAACVALDMLFKKEVSKIVITRPTVSREEIGFLPGDLKEKMDPWLAPIYSNFYTLYDKEKIDKLIAEGTIEVIPFAFMRGVTWKDSFVIVDESQNITHNQTEMILGRLGKGSKMVFCGDSAQIDLKNKKDSGISFFIKLESMVKGVRIMVLTNNHRHEIVEHILKVYSEFRD